MFTPGEGITRVSGPLATQVGRSIANGLNWSNGGSVLPLVLASTSRWRLKMLTDAGLVVRGVAPGIEERLEGLDPVRNAIALARAKADAVAVREPFSIVIGADQVVFDGQEVFGKPTDPADHFRRLRSMTGRCHALVTGYAIVGGGETITGHARTEMHVRPDLTDDELRAYVATGEGSGCAGGYAVEGLGSFLFERIDGDFFNVIGLPLFDVVSALRSAGWRFGARAG